MKAKCIMRKSLVPALVFFMAMSLVSFSVQAKTITLIGETGTTATSVQGSVIPTKFTEEVEKRTNGRVKTKWSYGGAKASHPEVPEVLKSGLIQIGGMVQSYTAGLFPLLTKLAVTDFNLTTVGDLVATNVIANQLLMEFPEIQAEITKQNMKLLAWMPMDELGLISTKPILKFEDLKGKKIRASIEIAIRALNAGGATGVSIPWSEAMTSLQTGLIDGIWTNAGFLYKTKTHEIAPYTANVDNRAALPTMFMAMNLDTWKKIPAQDQAIIMEVSKEFLVTSGKMVAQERQEALDAWKADPKVTYTVWPKAERDKWAAACPDFIAEVGKELDGMGYHGTEMTNRMKELYKMYNAGTWKPLEAIKNF